MTDRYADRRHAGAVLATYLRSYAHNPAVVVLALPRGGVPVAYEIAKALHAPLDVFIVRKLGVPGHSELAMGAIAIGGVCELNEAIIQDLSIEPEAIQVVKSEENVELQRRSMVYRGERPFPVLKDKMIILVDDGIATGATMRVAIRALLKFDPVGIVVAVPVAEDDVVEEIGRLVDQIVCPLQVTQLYAVGSWYEDFAQVEDEEVFTLLNIYRS